MECKCGGIVETKRQPKVKNKKVIAVAELQVCSACGRNAGSVKVFTVDRHGLKDKRIR
jgi:hypothetical protein